MSIHKILDKPMPKPVCTVEQLCSYTPKTDREARTLNTIKRFFPPETFDKEWHGVRRTFRHTLMQRRVGYHGIPISIHKFITMEPGQESNRVDRHNGEHDTRVKSSWHWFLRKSHFDELPQLRDVMRGELGVVGVRALLPYDLIERHTPEEIIMRLSIKPGAWPLDYAWPARNRDEMIRNVVLHLPQFKKEKEQHPALTTIKYWLKINFNLLAGRVHNHA